MLTLSRYIKPNNILLNGPLPCIAATLFKSIEKLAKQNKGIQVIYGRNSMYTLLS